MHREADSMEKQVMSQEAVKCALATKLSAPALPQSSQRHGHELLPRHDTFPTHRQLHGELASSDTLDPLSHVFAPHDNMSMAETKEAPRSCGSDFASPILAICCGHLLVSSKFSSNDEETEAQKIQILITPGDAPSALTPSRACVDCSTMYSI